jgi:glycosyltransferase involved in cell wall biosynthesis
MSEDESMDTGRYDVHSLRQYPAASHDAAFEYLAVDGNATISRHQYEMAANPTGAPSNLAFLLRELLTSRGDLVVLGAEPYDWRVPVFDRLARRHDVVLHTSWPYWGTNDVPQPAGAGRRDRWASFLQKVHAVGVTTEATESVRETGAGAATHVPHGVDTDVYHPAAGRDADRQDTPVVQFVGRLEARKGVGELLEGIAEWRGPETTFRFVGDGPMASAVEAAATEHPIEYTGYVGEERRLASLYATADVLVLPSYAVDGWEELFGIVVIEALSSGTPVVATDCVGPSEIVDHGETGYVVDQHDVEGLMERLHHVVSDADLADRLGRRAREVATDRYDWQVTAEAWAAIFDAVSGSGTRPQP